MKLTLIATAAMGLETVLAYELKDLGYQTKVSDGKVEFEGDLSDICKANLWLRSAGRIYIKMATFKAVTFDELYDQTRALPWEDWIGSDDSFPVSKVTSRKSELFSKSDCQAIVKKAVASRLIDTYNLNALPETGAQCAIRIQIESDTVVLSLDTTGHGLNKRGYRAHHDEAPLRETLAAGLILLSRWNPERDVLLDPLCGTATILIEAGLIAKNIAPGLYRSYACEGWKTMSEKRWEDAREAAEAAIKHDAEYRIFGSDRNARVLDIARKNIQIAGLDKIFVQTLPVKDIQSRFETGKIITNPPYGARLSDLEQVELLYAEMGEVFLERFQHWSYYILTPHDRFERLFGARSTKHRKLFNGPIQCWLYQYFN